MLFNQTSQLTYVNLTVFVTMKWLVEDCGHGTFDVV